MIRGLASLYREGMNTSSSTYAFLCFYKIVESMELRRSQLAQICLDLHCSPIRFETIKIPSHVDELKALAQKVFPKNYEWDPITLQQVFRPETHSKTVFAVAKKYLAPLRKRVAHALLDSGEFANLDDPKLIRNIEGWLPFVRFAGRFLILSDLNANLPETVQAEFEKKLTHTD